MILPSMLIAVSLATSPTSSTELASPQTACAGLSEAEKNMGLFVRAADIESAVPLRERRYKVSRSNALPVLKGAIVHVRAVPGLSVSLLQRIVDCHAAEVAALSAPEPWMSACPLFVPGAAATVRSEGGRYVVEIRAPDAESAAEVLGRSLKAAGDLTGTRAGGASTLGLVSDS